MFLRRKGRRILLLHSYRDGRGKVCQRRLGHFVDPVGLDRQLDDLPRRCPEVAFDSVKLRSQAQALLHQGAASPKSQVNQSEGRADRIGRAIRSLLNLLAEEEDPAVLTLLAADLDALQSRLNAPGPAEVEEQMASVDAQMATGDLTAAEQALQGLVRVTRGRLSGRRHSFDASDIQALPYLKALDRLGEVLTRQARLLEGAEVMAERVRACPTAPARLLYGSVLQKLGRGQEAVQQYACLPLWQADRHYNLASACWQDGNANEALVHLLRGLQWDPHTAEALARSQAGKSVWRGEEYWHKFGDLWNAEGRKFVVAIAAQPLVRRRLQVARETGVRVRSLIPPHSRVWLLQRGLDAAAQL